MKIRVNVTQRDIDKGRKRSCYSCPIATSLRRRGWYPTVGATHLSIDTGTDYLPDLPLPKKAQRFIRTFDRCRRDAQPFSFTLDLPIPDHSA